MKSRKNNF